MDCHREILAAVKAPKRGFVPLGNKKTGRLGADFWCFLYMWVLTARKPKGRKVVNMTIREFHM